MCDILVLATFISSDTLRQRWREGSLAPVWAAAYPELFDPDDLRIARRQAHLGYHFFEWLAAILLFHTQGLSSLVEQYTFPSHDRKRELIERMCDPKSVEFLLSRGKGSLVQCPDLLVYRPDLSDWFFCEVKGPRDRLQDKQVVLFRELKAVTGKEVFVVEFRDAQEKEWPG